MEESEMDLEEAETPYEGAAASAGPPLSIVTPAKPHVAIRQLQATLSNEGKLSSPSSRPPPAPKLAPPVTRPGTLEKGYTSDAHDLEAPSIPLDGTQAVPEETILYDQEKFSSPVSCHSHAAKVTPQATRPGTLERGYSSNVCNLKKPSISLHETQTVQEETTCSDNSHNNSAAIPMNRFSPSLKKLIYIQSIDITNDDVYCGREYRGSRHPGNITYRCITGNQRTKAEYKSFCNHHGRKTKMSNSLLENKFKGSRFIRMDNGRYVLLTKKEARKKISQSLRENKKGDAQDLDYRPPRSSKRKEAQGKTSK